MSAQHTEGRSTEDASLVLGLLDYIEQVEKLNARPAFSVPGEYFVAWQHELCGLPGLRFNLQEDHDDVWLRLPRLQETPPPAPPEALAPWLTLSKSPEKVPELRTELEAGDGSAGGSDDNSDGDGLAPAAARKLEQRPDLWPLFDDYVETLWTPWAAAERARRRSIALYNRLFALQRTMASEGAETPLELVWGVGCAAWKKEGHGIPVRHPLLTQPCEVSLDEKTFELEVRPRDIDPKLEIDCYAEMEVPGVRPLEAHWKAALATQAQRVDPFEASSFEDVLKAAVGHLDPAGRYEVRGGDAPPAAPDERLRVTDGWVLFARKRSGDIFIEDVRRLKKSVADAPALPGVIRSFVEPGDATVRAQPALPFRGLSSSDGARGDAFELYFPMPYNDEQVSIVQKLEANDGVVVQGPPGTGKTHTIANVICHYLARGQRVLVTAKGESPLAVLQDKLPERIRSLSVALLSDERDGMRQFEHSIQTIAANVAAFNPERASAAIAAAEAKLDQLHARISHLDRNVAERAAQHLQTCRFQGRDVSPEELARLVLAQHGEHAWFTDAPAVEADELPFGEADIDALRQARIAVADDLAYRGCTLPGPERFPAWGELLGLHRDIARARLIETRVASGVVPELADDSAATFEKARALADWLQARSDTEAQLKAAPRPDLAALPAQLALLQADDPVLQSFMAACGDLRALAAQRRQLRSKAVEAPPGAETQPDYQAALARLLVGKGAFALPFGKADARRDLAATRVQGTAPAAPADWQAVAELLQWRASARKASARWGALAAEFGLDAPAGPLEESFRDAALAAEHAERAHRLVFGFDAELPARIAEVFGPAQAERLRAVGAGFLERIAAGLQSHLDRGRLAHAGRSIDALVEQLAPCGGEITLQLRSFLTESVGQPGADEAVLHTLWNALQAELQRLAALRPALDTVERVAARIEAAGAAAWAARLRDEPAQGDADPATPPGWRAAWAWRRAVLFLAGIDRHAEMRELFTERRSLTAALAKTYQELVAEKTWLGVFHNAPPVVRQALQTYLQAVHAMGAGTGVRAVRHRRVAREAMLRAYRAVPCWVLPHWRVSETLPPEIGLFDLVVVDEASQSDIWALPALLRGKKLLVVGDHKQVSPSAVGMAETRITELRSRFLRQQPHGSEMTPDKSIYDLASVVFAGTSVMLREHFRSVPAIIEFSNREFYQGAIVPLRLPRANERLDPPLVDVFVQGGHRARDTNPAEAKAIVDEIEAILADPRLDGRSIGVVTLLGTAQAALIHRLASERISAAHVVERRLAIGPPTVFQGRERDIMLVSMVLAPGDAAAASRADMEQRFNVALSRARDRTYLFRSVGEAAFRPETLNARLMRHFRSPFTQDARNVQALRERCESGFEREMFDELVRRGFRVEPQVACGGWRIDFVVEGAEGRRLAIECDGDRFHGPGQWASDMARQRVLERAGWTFWRCFASSFTRRRQEVMDDLLATLHGLGIEPLGAEAADSTQWVQFKEVDPLGVATPEAETESTIEHHTMADVGDTAATADMSDMDDTADAGRRDAAAAGPA